VFLFIKAGNINKSKKMHKGSCASANPKQKSHQKKSPSRAKPAAGPFYPSFIRQDNGIFGACPIDTRGFGEGTKTTGTRRMQMRPFALLDRLFVLAAVSPTAAVPSIALPGNRPRR
jgi:hypothetical protein